MSARRVAAVAGVIGLVAWASAQWLGAYRAAEADSDRTTVNSVMTSQTMVDVSVAEGAQTLDYSLGVQLSAQVGNGERVTPVVHKIGVAGAQWLRVDIGWNNLQPTGPASYDEWYAGLVERVLAAADAEHLKVILSVWLTPDWAHEGNDPHAPPADPADYARAVGWAADRWGGRVDAWEIWNEPNFADFFRGADPATYVDLLCSAYPAVKDHDGSPVVFGGLMYADDGWLTRAYAAGAHGCFDVLGVHPYLGPSDQPPSAGSDGEIYSLTHLPSVHRVMERWEDGDLPIWITEIGWSTAPKSGPEPWTRVVTEKVQARYLREAVQLVRDRYPYVGPIIWYRDLDAPGDDFIAGFGLMHYDLSPKPSYAAFRAEARADARRTRQQTSGRP